MSESAEILKQQFSQSLGLPWTDILPASRFDELLQEDAFSYRNRVYSPIVTLWAMLYQALSADKSLRNTVKCITTWLTAAGIQPPSFDTGAYSKARSRFPESLLQRLIPETAECLAQTLSPEHIWCGRPVKVYDGITVLMADSAANQASFCHSVLSLRLSCALPVTTSARSKPKCKNISKWHATRLATQPL